MVNAWQSHQPFVEAWNCSQSTPPLFRLIESDIVIVTVWLGPYQLMDWTAILVRFRDQDRLRHGFILGYDHVRWSPDFPSTRHLEELEPEQELPAAAPVSALQSEGCGG